jgi:hypothetical protein
MGKRSDFKRLARDAYDTPPEAVAPLLRRLAPCTRFIEPCAGDGRLIEHLDHAGHVLVGQYDLPDDARVKRYDGIEDGVVFLTNSPWGRSVLHPIIVNLSDQAPTWLLIDADWVHTKQAIPFLPRLQIIVSVGRVRWIPGSPYDGKDNCAWHLFDRPQPDGHAAIRFVGRADPTRGNTSHDHSLSPLRRRPVRALEMAAGNYLPRPLPGGRQRPRRLRVRLPRPLIGEARGRDSNAGEGSLEKGRAAMNGDGDAVRRIRRHGA